MTQTKAIMEAALKLPRKNRAALAEKLFESLVAREILLAGTRIQKMKRIRWTEPARDDLRAIHKYIARDSEIYAQRMVDRILRRVEMLETFPEIGGQVEELGRKDIRELIEGNYRIIYRFRND